MLNYILCYVIISLVFSINGQFLDEQNFFTRYDIQFGQIFPRDLVVITGENVYVRMNNPVKNDTSCTYAAPNGVEQNVKTAQGKWV